MAVVTVKLTLEQAREVRDAIADQKRQKEAAAKMTAATPQERTEFNRSATILGKALIEFG